MSGIYENESDVKQLYLNTDLTDIAAVQSTLKNLQENAYITSKQRYISALNSATPQNISKARKYNSIAKSPITKNLGWIVMAVFAVLMGVIDSGFDDAITTWLSLGFWVGVGIQIYIAVLKSPWNTLTLDGNIIHSAISTDCSSSEKPIVNTSDSIIEKDKVICKNCGYENSKTSKFCESCGAKMSDNN